MLGVPEESRRKEVGLRARGGTGAAARSLRTDQPREAPRWPRRGPGGTSRLPDVPEGENVGAPSRGPSETRKGGAGAAPQRQADAPGGQRGSPECRGRPLRQAEQQGGRDTHKFLRFAAAVAARRRQLIRAPTLLLVPGPAAGPLAPAGRLHVLFSAGH